MDIQEPSSQFLDNLDNNLNSETGTVPKSIIDKFRSSTLSYLMFAFISIFSASKACAASTNAGNSNSKGGCELEGELTLLKDIESLKLKRDMGTLADSVIEFENLHSGQFSYFFLSTEPGAAPLILRGVYAGEKREQVLKQLDSLGFTVQAQTMQMPAQEVIVQPEKHSITDILLSYAPFILIAVIAVKMIRRIKQAQESGLKDVHSLGDPPSHLITERPIDRFADIAGIDHVVEDFKEMAQDIKAVMQGQSRTKLPRGTLVIGPPGVAKTQLARSLAGECGCPFLSTSAADLESQMLVGVGSARVRGIFKKARELRDKHTFELRRKIGSSPEAEVPCIIFIDEFDSAAVARNSSDPIGKNTEHNNTLNTYLAELDNIDVGLNRNIVVLAAANTMENFDPALLRPGRFSKIIHVPLPQTSKDRTDILKVLCRKILTADKLQLEDEKILNYIARVTPHKSGDHLRAIVQAAADLAKRADRNIISHADFFEAFQRAEFGRMRVDSLSERTLRHVAVHEHGHGILALACGISVFLVSMIPRGNTLGRVIPDPEGIIGELPTMKDMLSRILIALGGRSAELVKFDEQGITAGAQQDLAQARSILQSMIGTGMLADLYSMPIDRMDIQTLSEAHQTLINKVISRAVSIGSKIVDVVGINKLSQLVEDSLAEKRDLVGPEAQKFYEDRLPPNTLKQIAKLAGEFLKNPLGKDDASLGLVGA